MSKRQLKISEQLSLLLEQVGASVFEQRQDKRLGIRGAASEIGISPTTLSRIERGNLPDIGTLMRLVKWLER